MKENILVVDDERGQAEILKAILEREGYNISLAFDGKGALAAFLRSSLSLVLTDLKMPDMSGLELMDLILRTSPGTPIIIMTAHGTIDSAVEAIKKGGYDYLTKPLETDRLLLTIERGLERAKLLRENISLREELEERFKIDNIIGSHGKMQEIFKVIKKVAPTNSTVLILGESGTGKEMVARAIHYNSARKGRPFRAINCAAIPDTLLESELFGYEKGAFTGATGRKEGLLELTNGGTLFLDEIGELGMNMQAKLLRFLQEREIRRLGGKEEIKVDVRIIAATNRDLSEAIKERRFREDLYYRLNVISIFLPSLRERKTDIPELVEFFLKKVNAREGRKVKSITPDALSAIMQFSWPGNVRQLESVIERAVILCEGDEIKKDDLPLEVHYHLNFGGILDLEIPKEGIDFEELEKGMIIKALKNSHGVITKASALLGMTYKTLQYRIEKFSIKREDYIT